MWRVILCAAFALLFAACDEDEAGRGTVAGAGGGSTTGTATTTSGASTGGASASSGAGGAPMPDPGDVIFSESYGFPNFKAQFIDLAATGDGRAVATIRARLDGQTGTDNYVVSVSEGSDWVHPSLELASVTVGAASSVIAAGKLAAPKDLGGGALAPAGGDDAALVGLDASGAHVFSNVFGDAADQRFTDVATDAAGNIALVGTFDGSIDLGGGALTTTATASFLARFGPDGSHLMSRALPPELSFELVTTSGDALVAVGAFQGAPVLDGATIQGVDGSDGLAAAFDPTGALLWHLEIAGPSGQNVYEVATDATGRVLVLVNSDRTFDLNGVRIPDGRSLLRIAADGAALDAIPLSDAAHLDVAAGPASEVGLVGSLGNGMLRLLAADLSETWAVPSEGSHVALGADGGLYVGRTAVSEDGYTSYATIQAIAR